MFKSSPSRRNPRWNTVKMKYAVQILLLLGVSLWLLYQVKHSRDQNPTLLGTSSTSLKTLNVDEISKLRPKGLPYPPPEIIVEDVDEEEESDDRHSLTETENTKDRIHNTEKDTSVDFENPEGNTEAETQEGLKMSHSPEASVLAENSTAEYQNVTTDTNMGDDKSGGDESNEVKEEGFRNGEKVDMERNDVGGPVAVEDAKAPTAGSGEEGEEKEKRREEYKVVHDDTQVMDTVMETRTDLGTLPDTGTVSSDIETTAAE